MSQNNSTDQRSIFRRIRARLGPARLAYVLVLCSAVALYSFGLKAFQIAGLEEAGGFGVVLELCRSEIFVVVAFTAAVVGLALLGLRRSVYFAASGLLQAVAAYTVFANIIGYYFFQATGSALNWGIFVHGLSALQESPEVIHSEVPGVGWVLLVFALLMVTVAPPVVAWLVGRRSDDETGDRPAETRLGVVFLVGALIALFVAAIPASDIDYETGFARDQGLHLVITALVGSSAGGADSAEPWFDIADAELVGPDGDGPDNVVFVILESVRASATTPYNSQLETTPYLDELADDSLFFEQAYAMVPHTSKALVAMLCGVPPRIIMDIAESRPGGGPGRCMPTLLGDVGYRSLFMQSATEQFEARRGLVANMGFDDFLPLEQMDTEGYEEANYFGYEDDIMLPYSADWLGEYGDQPFMTAYLTITPHHDYRAPGTYGFFEFHDNPLINRYLNSVRYIDHFVENLIDQYKELGLYESTLFVIAGDHGEAFGEHGREQHDNVPWQEGIHIPLIIHDGSSSTEPVRHSAPVSHIDLVPTVLEMLDFEVTDGSYPGYVADQIPPDRIVFFSCWYDDQCAGFLHDGHKFIHHFGNRRDELFNVLDDPQEQDNLLADEVGRFPETTSVIFDWTQSVDAAYDRYFNRVISRQVLAGPPHLEEPAETPVGDALEFVGYEWRDDPGADAPSLVIGLRVLRDFTIGDSAILVIDDGSETLLTRPVMRGVFPSLFWQEGQYLVDKVPRSILGGADSTQISLYLRVGDTEEKILSFDAGAHY